jgi:hypothetical protein
MKVTKYPNLKAKSGYQSPNLTSPELNITIIGKPSSLSLKKVKIPM